MLDLRHGPLLFLLRNSSVVLLALVFLVFSTASSGFLEAENIVNILLNSSSVAIVAIGMTFVLLVGGIDLSVGSVMFLAAVIAGKLTLSGTPVAAAVFLIILVGLVCGAVNALLIVRFRIMAFIVTLSTLYLERGLGLYLSQTRAMNLPDEFLRIGSSSFLGIPFPILVLAAVLGVAHFVLTRTPFGRHLYAVGNDPEGARKAGLRGDRVIVAVYLTSGLCAALAGIVSVAQLGAVSPTFGKDREFAAISAAVLGGTSLFGGRGSVFPGTILGAILVQTVDAGLNSINADPYVYPLVLGAIIFLTVLVDGFRHRQMEKLGRRPIRPVEPARKGAAAQS